MQSTTDASPAGRNTVHYSVSSTRRRAIIEVTSVSRAVHVNTHDENLPVQGVNNASQRMKFTAPTLKLNTKLHSLTRHETCAMTLPAYVIPP